MTVQIFIMKMCTVSEYDSADFHTENVQTAIEDIQIEKEQEFEPINTYEPELEL